MNDTQIWTALIGMLTGMLAFMTLVLYVFDTSMDHRFQAVFTRFDQVDARFTEVDRRFDRLEARFDRLEARVDGLDRDVMALTRRGLGDQ